jgi:pimeloyl-ACP methyl ester carboxylesterase
MNRRQVLRSLGSAGVVGVLPGLLPAAGQTRKVPAFQIRGAGPTLLLCDLSGVQSNYVDRLSDRYRVITMDYPPTGEEARAVETTFAPERVCADILAVADAAAAEHFAWFGYSWGGVVGLQLASRTSRLTAMICGGWPPLGAPYKQMARVAGRAAERAGRPKNMATFYRGLEQWPERKEIAKFTVPRMVLVGGSDIIARDRLTVRIGPLVAEHRVELQRMGWVVQIVDNFSHELNAKPEIVVPFLREFLDPLLLRS